MLKYPIVIFIKTNLVFHIKLIVSFQSVEKTAQVQQQLATIGMPFKQQKQLNLSTMLPLMTEKSGHCREVSVMWGGRGVIIDNYFFMACNSCIKKNCLL